ncbi:hypothetical protein [Paenarthrobacter aurescens]|uniref:hypothetical protein n=1 Tax=Paenarthrobacter aurescens TaxID=43663 RepID=UPI0021BFDC5C|nr:hypothetical protein [Paenarthrobacter aurescens]MCT9868351.1 hypothetical protein [Paenarthrobacter aurescens]
MIVTLTIQSGENEPDLVSAEAATYEEANVAAEARIPDGFKAIVIHTDDPAFQA